MTGARGMGDQIMKTELHLSTVGMAEPFAVQRHLERQMYPTLRPCITQLVGCDGIGRHGAGRLGLDPAEPGPHFDGRDGTQGPIVYEQD